jgi:hypothetical protein
MKRIINYLKELKREFIALWKEFREYYSADKIAEKLDKLAEGITYQPKVKLTKKELNEIKKTGSLKINLKEIKNGK